MIGTSALVYPVVSLPEIAANCGATTIEVNIEPNQFSSRATCSVFVPATVAVPALFTTGNGFVSQYRRIHDYS